MDVTALLNSNTTVPEQQKRLDDLRVPSRSRTPWDAGGYSLPIITTIRTAKTSQPRPDIHHDDSHISTPSSSLKHISSDCGSSLSSFTSSLQSTMTHLRYSSTSTLNSNSHGHHKDAGTDILSSRIEKHPKPWNRPTSLWRSTPVKQTSCHLI